MSDGSAQIRILAVDDHVLIREGIAVLVGTQPDMILVAEASNGREAIQQFRTHRPDVTLMDLQMPEMNGFDAIIAIREEFPDAKIVVLTTYEGIRSNSSLPQGGAQGIPAQKYLAQGTRGHDPSSPCGKERPFLPEASYQIAEHATDDALTPGRNPCLENDRGGKCKQANCGSALRSRRKPSKVESSPFFLN